MEEDNKSIANEQLSLLMGPSKFIGSDNNVSSVTSVPHIPDIQNLSSSAESVVNNNVNVNLHVNGTSGNVFNNTNQLGKEVNQFLNTENITDPLNLKKNYQSNLKIENSNFVDNSSTLNSTTNNIIKNGDSNISVINSNVNSTSIDQIPPSMESFNSFNKDISTVENKIINGDSIVSNNNNILDSNPTFNTNNQNMISEDHIVSNTNISTTDSNVTSNAQHHQNVISGDNIVSNISNTTTDSNDTSNVNNNFNSSTMNKNQQFVQNYSSINIENKATYKPLERMDSDPNPEFSNGQREIESNLTINEKIKLIEHKISEFEKIESESRNVNGEKENTRGTFTSLFEEIVSSTDTLPQTSIANVIPRTSSNINQQSMKENSINIFFQKMNSPPIWRTVLG